MFIGGCTGSTAGAIKVMRVLLVHKMLRRELHVAIHPREVIPVRLNDGSWPRPRCGRSSGSC